MSSLIVTNSNDSGAGSLRDTVTAAPPNSIITFDPSVTTIVLTSGTIAIPVNLRIIGNNGLPVVSGGGVSLFRLFSLLLSNLTVSMSDFTISDSLDGAIQVGTVGPTLSGITLNLDNMVIANNSAINSLNEPGGGINNNANATINITNSRFVNNSAGTGGGIAMVGGILNIDTSTFDRNSAIFSSQASGTGGGAIMIVSATSLLLQNSTISRNTSQSYGGGISSSVVNRVTIVNSTIAQNTSLSTFPFPFSGGGGIFIEATSSGSSIVNSTISYNSAYTAGGLFSRGLTIVLSNTLIAQNVASNPASNDRDIVGIFTGSTFNLIGIATNNVIGLTNGVNGNQVGTVASPIDPLTGALGNYGGTRETVALLAGSPAINAGSNALVPVGIVYDERGFPFLRIVDTIVDIGAFEFQPGVVCYSGKSSILVKDIKTGVVGYVTAENIFSDKHQVYSLDDNKFIPIVFNIVTGKVSSFVLLKKGLIEKNVPSQDFYITSGHKIVINEKETKVRDVPNAVLITVNPQNVYSICTEKQCKISVNNVKTLTWSVNDWNIYAKINGLSWYDNGKQRNTQIMYI